MRKAAEGELPAKTCIPCRGSRENKSPWVVIKILFVPETPTFFHSSLNSII